MVNSIRVLVIEDNSEVATLFSNILEGHQSIGSVYTVQTLEEAENYIYNQKVDVVTLDLFLGNTQGLETLIIFKEKFPTVPVIVITGHDEAGLSRECFKLGVFEYLSKPNVPPELLVKVCEYAYEYSKAEAELVSREATLSSLLTVAPIGIGMVVDQNIRWVNDFFCGMTGWSRDDVVGNNSRFLFKTDFEFNRVITGSYDGNNSFETVLLKKDGTELCILFRTSLLVNRSPSSGFIFAVLDITEMKTIVTRRSLLIDSLKLLNESFSGVDTIKSLLELIQDVTGIEAVAIRLKEGDDYPYFVYKGFSKDFVTKENFLCERDPDGSCIVDSQGDPVLECMCGCVIRGNFPKKSSSNSRCVFTSHGSFWTNSTTLLKKQGNGFSGVNIRDHCHAEGYESIAIIPLTSGSGVIGTLQLNDKLGGMFTEELIAFMEELAISITVAVQRDEHERKIKSLEIAKTRDLLESSRMLNSGIAHELRTPLQALLNCLEIINEEVDFDYEKAGNCVPGCSLLGVVRDKGRLIKELIDDGVDRTEYAIKVLDSLSEYSKIASSSETHLINVLLELKTIMKTLRFTNPFKDLPSDSFNLYIEEGFQGHVEMNRVDFSQLISNLCRNSREAIDHDDPRIQITVSYGKDEDVVCIVITDNGRGVDAQFGDRIFDPYFSTKDNPHGFNQGLGLAMVRDIVVTYAGKISYNSYPGHTQFIVELPCKH